MKEPIFLDIECYWNYFLVKFRNEEGRFREFERTQTEALDAQKIRGLLNSYTVVTFNGNNYDMPMLALALSGADNETLKEASDTIIVGNMKPWAFYKHYKVAELSYDHVDIQEPSPGVMVSLKMYGGRLHMPKMQDLPYEPDKMLTRHEMDEVNNYCGNDLAVTYALFEEVKGRIELRESMSAEYRTDLRSKSDAQVAEAVIKGELFRLSGKKLAKPSVHEKQFFFKHPNYISFKTKQLQDVYEMVLRSPFTAKTNGQIEMTEELSKTLISIGGTVYKLGIGGLHSQESEQTVKPDGIHRSGVFYPSLYGDDVIRDIDVTSYYPSIILNQNLYPETLGEPFLEVFKVLVDRRIAAKATVKRLKKEGLLTQDEQKRLHVEEGLKYLKDVDLDKQKELDRAVIVMDALRITINGAFGKLGSVYSALYAPDLMIQVTVTGQLTLLMLIEELELAGIPIVSANTDGIVMTYPKSMSEEVNQIIRDFEKLSGFLFEDTFYSGLYSRDVNNYIAIKTDGKVKTKGAFGPGGLQKNPQNDICNDALIEYLKDDIPPEQTIRECKDITKFVTVRTVRGGGVFNPTTWQSEEKIAVDGKDYIRLSAESRYLGKVVRWYYGTSGTGTINYKTSGNKVPRSDGAVPLMDLPLDFPNNVDYNMYENEVNELTMDIGLVKRPPVVKKTRSKKK